MLDPDAGQLFADDPDLREWQAHERRQLEILRSVIDEQVNGAQYYGKRRKVFFRVYLHIDVCEQYCLCYGNLLPGQIRAL